MNTQTLRFRPRSLRTETNAVPRRGFRVIPIGQLDLAPGSVTGSTFAEVRNVIQIPFDDSIDGTHPLECFFQMPTDTVGIMSAKVWVQRKSFRAYETTAAAGTGLITGATPSDSGGVTGVVTGAASGTTDAAVGNTASASPTTDTDATLTTPTSNSAGPAGTVNVDEVTNPAGWVGSHVHTDPQGGNTGSQTALDSVITNTIGVANDTHTHAHTHGSHSHSHSHGGLSHSHGLNSHTHTFGSHTHTVPDHLHTIGHSHPTTDHTHPLTYGIYEQAASGTLSLYVADDGATYGSALVTGASAITALDLGGLSIASGDKRIKIEGTGLMRVQVLIMLDLIIKVPPAA